MDLNSTSSSNSSLDDDELTNLTWLQDNNLLQNMTSNHTDSESTSSDCNLTSNLKEDNENVSPKKIKLDNSKKIDLEKNNTTTDSGTTMPCSVPPIRYNPLLHTHTKPPYSFSSLIFMAIESSPTKALPVKDIYNWISKNFPFYKAAPDGWKNTVRHNLSLNKCFQKIEKGKKYKGINGEDKKLLNDQIASKGSLWCVDQKLRPNLLQAIKKTPAHIYPYMSTAKTSTNLVQISNIIKSNNNQLLITNDNQPNNIDINNINSTVTIGNNATTNISPSNNFLTVNQSPYKKMITLEKLPQKNILTTAKRVLIPIGKVGREPKEADAAESMLTLTTQCNTTSNVNNRNMYYIITNKGENQQLLQIQLAPKQIINTKTATVKPQAPAKNQITAFLAQPIMQTISQTTATIAIPISSQQKPINNSITSTATSHFIASTDHNYSSRISTIKTNNLITIPAKPVSTVTGQPKFILATTTKGTGSIIPSSTPVNKNTHKVITITPAKQSPTKNLIIKAIVKKQEVKKVEEKKIEDKKTEDKKTEDKKTEDKKAEDKKTEDKKTEDKKTEDKKAEDKKTEDKKTEDKKTEDKKTEEKKTENNDENPKIDNVVNDEDGLKCAEALFNLANGSIVKMTKNSSEKKNEKPVEKKFEKTVEKGKDQNESVSSKKTTSTVQTTATLTRSASKKLKTFA